MTKKSKKRKHKVKKIRNPLAQANIRVNRHKVEPDRTKFCRKEKHRKKGDE